VSHRLLAGFWVLAGAMHFIVPRRYEAIVPPWLPVHREIVIVSGLAEIGGGAAVLHRRARPWAGLWLIGVLAAVFPANLHMALNPDDPKWARIPTALLWLRLPLQPLAGWWAWRATRD
jgi:uncharacterized membrane protein